MPPVTVPALGPDDVPAASHVIDIRPRARQARGLLPGSLGIEPAHRLRQLGRLAAAVPEPIALVAEPGQDVAEAVTQLAQIGIDTVHGVVRDLGAAATQTTSCWISTPSPRGSPSRRPAAGRADAARMAAAW